MKISFKRPVMLLLTLLVLVISALGVTPAHATWVFNNKTTTEGLGNNFINGVFVNGSSVYAATNGGLSISTNGGTSFINKTDSTGLGNNTVNGVFESGGIIYAATNSGLSISTDGGTSFVNRRVVPDGLGSNTVFGVFVNGSTVYAATNGGLSISTNGGTSFINKTTVDGLGDNKVNGVFVNGSTVYAATDGGLSISTDGGSTFPSTKTTADGLGSNTINVVFESAGTVYAATDDGLGISANGGTSFINKTDTNGLGNNLVKGVSASGSIVFAATNGGLSISVDSGNTFSNKTTANGLGSNLVKKVFVSGSTVYAATTGGLSIGADIDITAPTITSFTATTPVGNFSIPITAFTASDDFAVTGYLITESSTPPSSGAAGWSGTAPTSYGVPGNGSYTLYPWAKDATGNVSAVYGSPASVVVLDNTAPETTINTQPSNPDEDSTPTFTFSGNDGAGSGVASLMCKMDAGSFAACTSPFTSSALTDGSHTFTVFATDNAANADATPASYTWTLDTAAPETSIDTQPSNPDEDSTPTFTFSGTDGAGSGIASLMCKMDAGSFAVCTSPFTSSALADGSHTFTVFATDNAANADATPASYTWTIDATVPSVSSSVRTSASPTNLGSVGFTVTFSESVTGVDAGDFTLTTTGVTGASISGVTGSGATRTVTVNTGTNDGTIRLNVVDDDTIVDAVSNPLGGAGAANGDFTTGESYTINRSIQVFIGGTQQGSYSLLPGQSQKVTYNLDSGPVQVVSANAVPIVAALRDALIVNNSLSTFSQLMGLPDEQLSDTYWFPVYVNNSTLSGQLRFANVGLVDTTVTVTIGGVVQQSYLVHPNEMKKVTYALDAGPVKVQSSGGVPIVAALRDALIVNNSLTTFSQMMGIPDEGLSDTYWFPAYVNNSTLSGQLRFANVGVADTTVTVTIGGVNRGSYLLHPNENKKVDYALDAGPVKITSSGGVPIVAALREALIVNGSLTTFSQMMGLPEEQLSDTFWIPAYVNNTVLNGQLRFANVGVADTTVTVTIGGVDRGSYLLHPNEMKKQTYALDAGPVKITSTGSVPIVAALRDALLVNNALSTFSQMMGLPDELLSDTYWFPAYVNNATLNGQLRFGVP